MASLVNQTLFFFLCGRWKKSLVSSSAETCVLTRRKSRGENFSLSTLTFWYHSTPLHKRYCDTCTWYFRRAQDMARHRCDSIRSSMQQGPALPWLVKALVQPSFRWLHWLISSATLQKDNTMGWRSLIKSSQLITFGITSKKMAETGANISGVSLTCKTSCKICQYSLGLCTTGPMKPLPLPWVFQNW